jgi:hypothetical protein
MCLPRAVACARPSSVRGDALLCSAEAVVCVTARGRLCTSLALIKERLLDDPARSEEARCSAEAVACVTGVWRVHMCLPRAVACARPSSVRGDALLCRGRQWQRQRQRQWQRQWQRQAVVCVTVRVQFPDQLPDRRKQSGGGTGAFLGRLPGHGPAL